MAAQECAAIAADLARLQSLIGDAGARLLASFNAMADALPPSARSAVAQRALGDAVTALQFQDMAEQLTAHAQRRLALLGGTLQGLAPAAGAQLDPGRQQPVHQSAMGAGSIELF